MYLKSLCIFNPEHDLCLANGGRNFVPPRSATQFADSCHCIMSIIYDACTTSINTVPRQIIEDFSDYEIIPWGWDVTLRQSLLRLGYPEDRLPDEAYIDFIRKMQSRETIVPLLTDSKFVKSLSEVDFIFPMYHKIVIKSPWSSSGRGIRRVSDSLNAKDYAWINKMIAEQGGVLVEPFRNIDMEFALEYDNGEFVGYSLFSSQNCVYSSNMLLFDDEIEEIISHKTSMLEQKRANLEQWLKVCIFPYYNGPFGVDMYIDCNKELYISEMNLRHTIGHLAHAFLRRNPQYHKHMFAIDKGNGIVVFPKS